MSPRKKSARPKNVGTLADVAAKMGVSIQAVKLLAVSGEAPGFERLHLRVDSAADVAKQFKVSRSVVSDWRKRGMPGNDRDGYDLAAIRKWRLALPSPPATMTVGTEAIGSHRATGGLTRSIFRWLKCELAAASIHSVEDIIEALAADATDEEAEKVASTIMSILLKHSQVFILTEAEAEQLIADLAPLA
jgi:hypothetical protein